ncbi:MAG TPA: PfkB family carbohydrate kinase [Trebonia sp.]|nr:PfkB family carbohydrate kinase [Trebonia sp.]
MTPPPRPRPGRLPGAAASPRPARPGSEAASPGPRPARPRRLVFAGEAIVDVLMRVPALPERGGDVLAASSAVTVGGGFNVMAAAARQGLPVLYAGGHGTGPWGDMVRAALAAEGIAVFRLPDEARDTGFDVALVEPDGERTFVTHLGAEALGDPGSWQAVPAGPGDAVYVSGYGLVPPVSGPVLGVWAAALPPGPLLFVDPGPLVAEIPAAVLGPVLARCDWLSCNQREAALLTGTSDPAEAASRLLARAPRASVIVRSGPGGCTLALRADRARPADHASAARPPLSPPALVRVSAPAVTVVDSTGAGDAHAGVFLAALADGLDPPAAAGRANAAAALAVTRPGPATSPTRADLDAWLTSITDTERAQPPLLAHPIFVQRPRRPALALTSHTLRPLPCPEYPEMSMRKVCEVQHVRSARRRALRIRVSWRGARGAEAVSGDAARAAIIAGLRRPENAIANISHDDLFRIYFQPGITRDRNRPALELRRQRGRPAGPQHVPGGRNRAALELRPVNVDPVAGRCYGRCKSSCWLEGERCAGQLFLPSSSP